MIVCFLNLCLNVILDLGDFVVVVWIGTYINRRPFES